MARLSLLLVLSLLYSDSQAFATPTPTKSNIMSLQQFAPSSANLHSPPESDSKKIPETSTGTFLGCLAAVPIWAFGVLPLSVAYQVGKAVLSPVLPKPYRPEIDSGYVVDPKQILDRQDRKYDLVVLGATGFTGKLATRHLAKTYGTSGKVKWAIAGRSQKKLDQVKKELADELGMEDIITQIDTIIVDASVPATLPNLVQNTRAVATTAGPFSLYGNSVVEFCAKFGTHYTDITGETDFVKSMAAKWEDVAKSTGARIVSFCGHDSIPWDLTCYKLEQALGDDEHLVHVTCHDEAYSSGSGGTMATMMLAMNGGLAKAPPVNPFEANLQGVSKALTTKLSLPAIFSSITLPWNKNSKAYKTPFVMAMVNGDVVSWSRSLMDKPAMVYEEFAVQPDFKTAFVSWFGLIGFFTCLLNPITAKMIPIPKPGEGSGMKEMEEDYFLNIYATGVGSKGTKVESNIYFDQCPGYLYTARMVVESALSMALEEKSLPVSRGGFFSPAVGLGDVLLDRLVTIGAKYSMKKVE